MYTLTKQNKKYLQNSLYAVFKKELVNSWGAENSEKIYKEIERLVDNYNMYLLEEDLDSIGLKNYINMERYASESKIMNAIDVNFSQLKRAFDRATQMVFENFYSMFLAKKMNRI